MIMNDGGDDEDSGTVVVLFRFVSFGFLWECRKQLCWATVNGLGLMQGGA